MVLESEQYQNRIATVVGGRGQLGSRVVKGFRDLGFGEVRVCEEGDPFRDFIPSSTDLFLAVDSLRARNMLQAVRDLLQPHHTILDGASVKTPLIPFYRELDESGISVCSTHLGAVPTQSWRGVKVWICDVGPNSPRARELATELYKVKKTLTISTLIEEHAKVELDQFFTMLEQHWFAAALRIAGIRFEDFNYFATLNSEVAGLSLGRTLGQGVEIPAEILFTQPRRSEFMKIFQEASAEAEHAMGSEGGLKEWMAANIEFHDDPVGTVDTIFRKAGRVGSRLANLRMYSMEIRTTEDMPGLLRKILEPFEEEGVNLTAIDSMPGIITPEEELRGIDPERIVDFDFGIDLTTMDGEKEQRIKEKLWGMGCRTSYSGHKLNR